MCQCSRINSYYNFIQKDLHKLLVENVRQYARHYFSQKYIYDGFPKHGKGIITVNLVSPNFFIIP